MKTPSRLAILLVFGLSSAGAAESSVHQIECEIEKATKTADELTRMIGPVYRELVEVAERHCNMPAERRKEAVRRNLDKARDRIRELLRRVEGRAERDRTRLLEKIHASGASPRNKARLNRLANEITETVRRIRAELGLSDVPEVPC